MGDSDDEYDRKRRDKFRGERSERDRGGLGERRDERPRHRADEWGDRGRSREYRDYRSGGLGGLGGQGGLQGLGGLPGLGARGYSPPPRDGPPPKRARDWPPLDDRRLDAYGSYGWTHDHYAHHHHAYAPQQPHSQRESGLGSSASGDTQPAMMTFKAFLAAQDDSITDDEAIKKYNEYKLEFRRQQLNEFFIAHKDEEWFKTKYHPEESLKRKEEQQASLQNRLNVFIDLLKSNHFERITIDVDQTDPLIKLLDTVVIKLEGGSDEDLKVLDEKPEPPPAADNDAIEIIDDKVENIKKENKDSDDESEKKSAKINGEKDTETVSNDKEVQEETKVAEETPAEPEEERKVFATEPPPTKRKRSRNSGESSGSSSGSSSSSSSSSDSSDSDGDEPNKREDGNADEGLRPPGENDNDVEEKQKDKSVEVKVKSDEVVKKKDPLPEVQVEDNSKKAIDIEKKDRREMHKTTSIFLRNLAPSITKAEVEAMCKRYGGFLRVALADPLPDRRWFRRGWVSFRREVNIKDICWNLNNIRLKDCELGAIVNRDLSRRIRQVNGVTLHKQIVRADARLAAKLCYHLDARASLWNTKIVSNQSDSFNQSSNPVLHNITEYLIEEAPAEEEELLGLANNGNTEAATSADKEEPTIPDADRDAQLTAVLDRLILYLRIVHSVDYYNHCEYPYEDEMPNRCGIMHARGPMPSSKPIMNEILDYIKTFEGKMSSFLQDTQTIDDDELVKLGTKDPQGEVEKFILANTQELDKDKWLCPLSGKKFKGPGFIRKHIFNKHAEKVDEVKKEVDYFNNYLKDPKRPQLQEHPASNKRSESSQPSSYSQSSYGAVYSRGGYGYPPAYGYAPPAYPPAPYASSRHIRSYNRGRGPPSDYRPIIHYRDLDAPREPEDFV